MEVCSGTGRGLATPDRRSHRKGAAGRSREQTNEAKVIGPGFELRFEILEHMRCRSERSRRWTGYGFLTPVVTS